jgi:phosphopantothenoylcysteine decarboxylase/phosphopantothenate--cysteine ligase
MKNHSILLIISGGIAAYKSLELIRLLKKSGACVRVILTKGGEQFVTPLSVSALSEHPVYTDLWSLKDESEMGHIRLSREADLIVVAPASANLIAKMANGIADDLASTTLLASNKPILISPAMNPEMWAKPSTQRNIHQLEQDGVHIIQPRTGDMACGETGTGRMPEATELFSTIENFF